MKVLLLLSALLIWDYASFEDRSDTWFEIWHTPALSTDFALMTNTFDTHLYIDPKMTQEFFIIRAVNTSGASDWAK